MQAQQEKENVLASVVKRLLGLVIGLVIVMVGLVFSVAYYTAGTPDSGQASDSASAETASAGSAKASVAYWTAPAESTLSDNPEKELVLYGKDLIVHTAAYFGPNGSISAGATNGLNCQNCHLDAGTKVFGNNYSAVASTYPKYRARSGKEESVQKRVNDCFERSLNGKALGLESREMKAIVAYIGWLGKEVPKGSKPEGSGLKELAYLDRAADPQKGKLAYELKCASCHQQDGGGTLNGDKTEYTFPPLWGKNSYNNGAGLYRLSNMARYIKYNMPLGASHDNPQLSDEEAWDIAAFVNSQNRPELNLSKDWPEISEKPIDHPYGPFADQFSETQHKYGPFKPIADSKKVK